MCTRTCGFRCCRRRNRTCIPQRRQGDAGLKPVVLFVLSAALASAAGLLANFGLLRRPYLEILTVGASTLALWSFKVLVFRKYLPKLVTQRTGDHDSDSTCSEDHTPHTNSQREYRGQVFVKRANRPLPTLNVDLSLPVIPRKLKRHPLHVKRQTQAKQLSFQVVRTDPVAWKVAAPVLTCNVPQQSSAAAVSLRFGTPVAGDSAAWSSAFQARARQQSVDASTLTSQPLRRSHSRASKKTMSASRAHLAALGVSRATLRSLRRAHRHRVAPGGPEASCTTVPSPASPSSPSSPGASPIPLAAGQEPKDHLHERAEEHADWVRLHYSVPLQGRRGSMGVSLGGEDSTAAKRRRHSRGAPDRGRPSASPSPSRPRHRSLGYADDSDSSCDSKPYDGGGFSLYEAGAALPAVGGATAEELLLPVHRRMRALESAAGGNTDDNTPTTDCAICLSSCAERCVTCRGAGLHASACGSSNGECGHTLHTHCMDKWRKHCKQRGADTTCPLCKSEWR